MPERSAEFRRFRTSCRFTGLAAAAVLATLQACSSIPDAANPVEWYKGARDWVAGEDTEAKAKEAADKPVPEIPGKDQPFPKVSSVPEAPNRSTEEERKKAAQSLIADRERARYTDEVIRRQTASIAPAPPPAETIRSATPNPAPAPTPSAAPEPPRAAVAALRAAPAPTSRAAPAATPPPPMRAETVQPPVRPAPPPPMRAETLQPPARPAPPPASALQAVRPPPPPPLPAPPIEATPSAAPPSQLVFGPPPSDIALVQNERNGRSANGPPGGISIESLLPPRGTGRSSAPATPPPIASAPDPSSLDPTSQVAIVTFEQGSSRLSGTAKRIIREVVEMQHRRGGRLHVIGYSSSWTRDMNLVRHNMINFGLSLDRANAVARELMQYGLAARNLTIGALSDARPLFFEVMPSGEAGNRRVEIYLDGG